MCPYTINVKSDEDKLLVRTSDDNKDGLSVKDKQFIKLMDGDLKLMTLDIGQFRYHLRTPIQSC